MGGFGGRMAVKDIHAAAPGFTEKGVKNTAIRRPRGSTQEYTPEFWGKERRDAGRFNLHPKPILVSNERAIRPFVVGRKNWLFSGSPRGADASCFFYSLIETAKANNLNPYDYLTWIFKTAPRLSKAQYENLLPWEVDREAVKRAAGRGWRN